MRSYSLTFLVNILASSANATPWGMPGEAVIRSENGKLLICTPVQASPSVSARKEVHVFAIPIRAERCGYKAKLLIIKQAQRLYGVRGGKALPRPQWAPNLQGMTRTVTTPRRHAFLINPMASADRKSSGSRLSSVRELVTAPTARLS